MSPCKTDNSYLNREIATSENVISRLNDVIALNPVLLDREF